MEWEYNTRYPSLDDVKKKAKKRIPGFAFEYLEGGCNEDVNLYKNTDELRQIELVPHYLKQYQQPTLKTELFGNSYDAPFGIAPIGLQGLMWPGAAEILAKAACRHNIPFILSTVTTASIETIGKITEGKAWYQLYHPAENEIRDNIINRLKQSQYDVLVVLCDVPVFGFRPRDIRNGLSMPPRMTLKNILQILCRPAWAYSTLIHGTPGFSTLKPYMPANLNMKQLGLFMNQTFSGRLSKEKISQLRDMWKGKMILKGVSSVEDAEMAIQIGLDGIIVSNHGGRQLDAGQSAINSLRTIIEKHKGKIKIMMDSGIRTGPDVARAMAYGAEFTFMGRTFMYGVSALGKQGGEHTIGVLKTQLLQVMEQLSCSNTIDFPEYLVK